MSRQSLYLGAMRAINAPSLAILAVNRRHFLICNGPSFTNTRTRLVFGFMQGGQTINSCWETRSATFQRFIRYGRYEYDENPQRADDMGRRVICARLVIPKNELARIAQQLLNIETVVTGYGPHPERPHAVN
jgi:hypothetical protein